MKLVLLVALAAVGWRLLTGRWPGQRHPPASAAARSRLGVGAGASREEILAAHRALVARVHPDRGGSSEAVHAADAARDLLLADLSARDRRSG